ncbi:hypothetical protein CE91St42_03160 [Oscillospiraceae bacterium]|nr:hypothetical protein CE91St42_03160 [Oscillospiraceae bacterium]
MNNEATNRTTAAADASPLTVKEAAPPVMVKKIGKTTYRVKIHFSETSKETMSDKIKRLILNDSEKIS